MFHMYLTLVLIYCRHCCKNSRAADTIMFGYVSVTVVISDGMRCRNDYGTVVWELSGRKDLFQCTLHEVCLRGETGENSTIYTLATKFN
jgi:hypothetical protein